jgi:mono/diheme cytochrome c family protein
MKPWIRRSLWATASLLMLAAATVAGASLWATLKMKRVVDVQPSPVALRSDAAALERGRYLYASRGCADCPGANGAGRTFVDDGHGLKLAGANISPGPGSVVTRYTAQDWVRTLRHGVKPDGRPLMIMPSEDYNLLTDDDVGALVAYVRSLPPAAGGPAVLDLPLPVRVLYGLGVIRDAAAKIDHQRPPSQPVPEGVTVEHGRYVANMCVGCHGPQLAGGKIPGGPPDWPAAANLTGGNANVLARYPDADSLLAMFRSGKRPDGSTVQVMPFESLRAMNEVDARALHLYLKTLPPQAGS